MSIKVIAHFLLDKEGKPKLIKDGDRKHYWIDIKVIDAPKDTYAVNYELDDSYYDSVRESRDSEKGFAERLTSYGDYTVQVKLRTKNRVESIATNLAEALALGHAGSDSKDIAKALKDIENN